MKLEVLLSVMNITKQQLDELPITSSCIVINQSDKNDYEEYKNFKIYSYNEKGISRSRNKALKHASADILLFCDDDIIYTENYEKIILDAFKKNKKADVIFFNLDSPNRFVRKNKRNHKVHIYNALRYGTYNIALRKESISKYNLCFNELFGNKEYYHHGEDTIFIVDCLKHKLRLYASKENIGLVKQAKSSWFNGYNEKYFFDKGAIFNEISNTFSHLLCLQYLLRYRKSFNNIKFLDAYKIMLKGVKSNKDEV